MCLLLSLLPSSLLFISSIPICSQVPSSSLFLLLLLLLFFIWSLSNYFLVVGWVLEPAPNPRRLWFCSWSSLTSVGRVPTLNIPSWSFFFFFFFLFFHTGNLINGINYYFLKQNFHSSLVLVLGSRLIFAWLYKAVINLILI